MQPSSYCTQQRARHLRAAIIQAFTTRVADENDRSTEDAFEMTRRLAEEGLFVGASARARTFCGNSAGKQLKLNAVIVTVLCDGDI